MASPAHRRSPRMRRTALISAALTAAGLGALPLVMPASAATDLAHQALPPRGKLLQAAQDQRQLGPAPVRGREFSAKNLPTSPAGTTGTGVLTAAGTVG